MFLTIVLKKTRQLSARVSSLAKELIALEQKATGQSEGEIIEQCLLQCIRSPDALKLIRQYAQEDPTVAAIMAAFDSPGAPRTGRKCKNN